MHAINLIIHISAGVAALIAGSVAIFSGKGSKRHRYFGRIFLVLLSVVVATGMIGAILFRSNPFLLMLTFLSGYVGYAGWRNLQLKEREASLPDAGLAAITLVAGTAYAYWLQTNADNDFNPAVIYSTLGALWLVTVYDLLRYFFLHAYLKQLWLYEHIYKTTSAFSAIFSAFTGTVLPGFKPYSQVGPSAIMMTVIVTYIVIEAVRKKRMTVRRVQTVMRGKI